MVNSYADAPVEQEDGSLVFVEPLEVLEPFSDFLNEVQHPKSEGHIKYAQPQNDSLRTEYGSLFTDVPEDIDFARIALEKTADAVNFWLGNERSITSLHKDNYENVYVQIRGQKHFVLMAPIEMPCVGEQMLAKGRYAPATTSDTHEADHEHLMVQLDEQGEPIPVATWDPDLPDRRQTAYSHLAKPLRVTLREGDMLYLPAMWYHKVSQTCGEEDFACAINYWYDMDFAGGFWASNSFLRDVMSAKETEVKYPDLSMGEDETPSIR